VIKRDRIDDVIEFALIYFIEAKYSVYPLSEGILASVFVFFFLESPFLIFTLKRK